MSKPLCVVSCPIDCYSGYSARSRDFVDSLIRVRPDWEIKILPQRWGNTRWGYLKDHGRKDLLERLITQIPKKPEIWIQITIPNEFQKVGTFNVGVTAGIETTLCSQEWIAGINRMDLVITSSNFAKTTFLNSKYEGSNNTISEATIPVEVLFEGVDTSVYHKLESSNNLFNLDVVQEPFAFLMVGHWLSGTEGSDRKNITSSIRMFLETFKNKVPAPALILKTQIGTACHIDKEIVYKRINEIKSSIKASKLPNIYLVHGDLTDEEMNSLYNHPKVKAMISLTKGEGFGRPLLEFSTTGKPIFASGWSGHTDFLHPDKTTLLPGVLHPVDPSIVDGKMFLKEAKWFQPDINTTSKVLKEFYKHPKSCNTQALSQRRSTLDNFTIEQMDKVLHTLLLKYSPEFPKFVELKLEDLQLPKLTKNE